MKTLLALAVFACCTDGNGTEIRDHGFAVAQRGPPNPGKDKGSEQRFEITTRRADTRITVREEDGNVVFDVRSEFGIDRAAIRRRGETWPRTIIVRLHLAGLESLRAGNGDVTAEWSASAEANASSRMSLWRGRDEQAIDSQSPYWAPVRVLAANKHPQPRAGDNIETRAGNQTSEARPVFELTLPTALFRDNPSEITLAWVDFYRN